MNDNFEVRFERNIFQTVFLSAFCFLFCLSLPVQAKTLEQVLSQAYEDNPDLLAARIN